MSDERRQFIKGSAALAAGGTVLPAAWAQGSDAPEKKEVRIGFIPLTDCASVVMASVLKFDEKYGIKIVPTKEASWTGVRDKLVNGELAMAQVLYGLVYGVHLGVGGPKKDMAVLMNLNHNGQAITLSKKLADKGAVDVASLAKAMAADKREYTYAQTFPTGTHAMWLYYWLASGDINPLKDTKVITVTPPQMVANMRVGNTDGSCVGEPWNHRAIIDGIGIMAATTQDVWKDHPDSPLDSRTAPEAAPHAMPAAADVEPVRTAKAPKAPRGWHNCSSACPVAHSAAPACPPCGRWSPNTRQRWRQREHGGQSPNRGQTAGRGDACACAARHAAAGARCMKAASPPRVALVGAGPGDP